MSCSSCTETEVEYSNKVVQLGKEIAFLEERYQLTMGRKGDLMQDWLADQRLKNLLRCQIRGAGLVPIV